MGLKEDLIKAKQMAWGTTARTPQMVMEAELTRDAILNFLSSEDLVWTINKFKASVELEKFETDDIAVNVEPETLLGEWGPVLKVLKTIASLIGEGDIIDGLEKQLKEAIKPVVVGGSTLPALDLQRAGGRSGTLNGVGYAYIGDKEVIDVENIPPENEETEVRLDIDRIPEELK